LCAWESHKKEIEIQCDRGGWFGKPGFRKKPLRPGFLRRKSTQADYFWKQRGEMVAMAKKPPVVPAVACMMREVWGVIALKLKQNKALKEC
jgi:hypothetical protein